MGSKYFGKGNNPREANILEKEAFSFSYIPANIYRDFSVKINGVKKKD